MRALSEVKEFLLFFVFCFLFFSSFVSIRLIYMVSQQVMLLTDTAIFFVSHHAIIYIIWFAPGLLFLSGHIVTTLVVY